MPRIVIVEDNIEQLEELQSFLVLAGHEVFSAGDSIQLKQGLQHFTPEVALLDYNLPGESGATIAEYLRNRFGSNIGIVMVTARSSAIDRIQCRRKGADTYLVKPIDFEEARLIIDKLYSRIQLPSPIGDAWRLSAVRAEVEPPGEPAIPLTRYEFLLLQELAAAACKQVDRDTLVRALGKNPEEYDPRALEANISRLRSKLPLLEDGRNPLQAMRGMGYQFIRPLTVIN